MLDSFHELLEYADSLSDPIYVLSTTSVAHTFCRNYPGCDKYPAIQQIVDYLENSINNNLDNRSLSIRAQREKACIYNYYIAIGQIFIHLLLF